MSRADKCWKLSRTLHRQLNNPHPSDMSVYARNSLLFTWIVSAKQLRFWQHPSLAATYFHPDGNTLTETRPTKLLRPARVDGPPERRLG
jgi:hypothetical protein